MSNLELMITDHKLRVGIIGAGGGVAAVHFQAYQELNCIEVVAGAELNEVALVDITLKWGVKGYLDFEEMLKVEQLDIVCICVPARYHREVAEKAAEYKVHVLIEKPLATNLIDGQAILEACQRNGVKLYYGASYRTLTANIKAREMIRNGDLGEISMAMESVIGGEGLDSYKECGAHHYARGTPGGCGMGIVDHGVHLIDLFCWFLDTEVDTVFGRGNISGEAPASEHLTATFKNGTVVHLIANTISFSAQLPTEGVFRWGGSWDPEGNLSLDPGWASNPASFQIHGSKGALKVYPYAEQLIYFAKDTVKPIRLEQRPMPKNFALQMESFVDSIVNNRPPAVTGKDGMRALEIILAAYKSAEKQQLIKL
jgi:predicted dehydrogenase